MRETVEQNYMKKVVFVIKCEAILLISTIFFVTISVTLSVTHCYLDSFNIRYMFAT